MCAIRKAGTKGGIFWWQCSGAGREASVAHTSPMTRRMRHPRKSKMENATPNLKALCSWLTQRNLLFGNVVNIILSYISYIRYYVS